MLRVRFAGVLATRSRDAWAEHFEGTDACVTPVLDLGEAEHHPHAVARGALPRVDGVLQAAPAPRFSRSATAAPAPPPAGPVPVAEVLAGWA